MRTTLLPLTRKMSTMPGTLSCRGGVLRKLKAGRNPKDGGWLAGGVSARGVRGRGPGCDEGWMGCCSATCSVLISLQGGTDSHESQQRAQRATLCWTSSVVDAVSLIRTSPQKKVPAYVGRLLFARCSCTPVDASCADSLTLLGPEHLHYEHHLFMEVVGQSRAACGWKVSSRTRSLRGQL